MDYNGLEKSLKKSDVYPVYVVFGDEHFLAAKSRLLIKSRVLGGEMADMLMVEYNGKGCEFGQIRDELWTSSLFGRDGRRLIVIEEAADFLKKYRKKLSEYILSPSPHACLLLISNKSEAWLKKLPVDNCVAVECKKIRDYQLPAWVVKRAAVYNKKITASASTAMLDETGNNLALLDNHIMTLSTYTGSRDVINEDDVDAVIFNGRKRTVFELTDAMASRDSVNALRILGRLISLGDDCIKIIALLGWQVRRLWSARRIIDDCCGDDHGGRSDRAEVAARFQTELKVNSYFFDSFRKQVSRFTQDDLQRRFRYIVDADVEIKTSSLNPQVIVECLLVKLCS